MNKKDYYEALRVKHLQTDWNNYQSVKEYNNYARNLRSQMEWEMDNDDLETDKDIEKEIDDD